VLLHSAYTYRDPVPGSPPTPGNSGPPTTLPPWLPPPADPRTDGPLTVSGISPRFGITAGGDWVSVDGHGFTDDTVVLFDGQQASVIAVVNESRVVVHAPPHPTAAVVDLRVSIPGHSVVLRQAYSYVPQAGLPPWAGGATTTTTVAGGGPTTTSAAPGATTTPGSPGTAPGTAPAPGGSATTTAPPAPPPRFAFGGVAATRGDLRLRPVSGTSPLTAFPAAVWPGRRCLIAVCAGTRL
jgi:IPT/TIG domain